MFGKNHSVSFLLKEVMSIVLAIPVRSIVHIFVPHMPASAYPRKWRLLFGESTVISVEVQLNKGSSPSSKTLSCKQLTQRNRSTSNVVITKAHIDKIKSLKANLSIADGTQGLQCNSCRSDL